jgi:hypothetical protein
MSVKLEYSKETNRYIISKPIGAVILRSDEMKELAELLKKEGF